MVQFEVLYKEVFSVLQMKCQDMHNQGIRYVTEEDLWSYFLHKKWHDLNTEEFHIYEIVSDIFALSIEQYKAYLHSEKIEKTELLAIIEEEERIALLGIDKF